MSTREQLSGSVGNTNPHGHGVLVQIYWHTCVGGGGGGGAGGGHSFLHRDIGRGDLSPGTLFREHLPKGDFCPEGSLS